MSGIEPVFPVLRRRRVLALALGMATFAGRGARAAPASGAVAPSPRPPPLMLAGVYRPGIPLADYWVSEKMDGVRGYWDGARLWTRGGEEVAAPAWFTAGWPKVPMDGELWAGRGQFQKTVSIVRRQKPDDPQAWRALRFMVFDLPAQGGTFTERLAVLNGLLGQSDSTWARPVQQSRVESHAELMQLLRTVLQNGGEGLVLHRGGSVYRVGRGGSGSGSGSGVGADDLLKLKPFEDADARVIGYAAGHGKYAGMTGALEVEAVDGRRFRIGSGLSDEVRRHPPGIGRWVSYRFRGRTDRGVPRFATFLRERPDLD